MIAFAPHALSFDLLEHEVNPRARRILVGGGVAVGIGFPTSSVNLKEPVDDGGGAVVVVAVVVLSPPPLKVTTSTPINAAVEGHGGKGSAGVREADDVAGVEAVAG